MFPTAAHTIVESPIVWSAIGFSTTLLHSTTTAKFSAKGKYPRKELMLHLPSTECERVQLQLYMGFYKDEGMPKTILQQDKQVP